jgi:hypothetical protein
MDSKVRSAKGDPQAASHQVSLMWVMRRRGLYRNSFSFCHLLAAMRALCWTAGASFF